MSGGFCPNCGTPRTGQRFCASCGNDFWKAAEAGGAQPRSGSQQPAAGPPVTPAPARGPVVNLGRLARMFVLGVIGLAVAVIAISYLSDSSGGPQPGTGLGDATPTPPVDTSTPTPEATAVSFTAIKLTGSGNKVPKFTIPEDAAAIATITNRGSANFVVTSLAADGSANALLVNVIGSYSGTVLFDSANGEHSVALQVESNGSWTITIKPLSSARTWNPSGPLTGKGDDVVLVSPARSGLTTATITHKGSANFVVYAYSTSGGIDLLVNEIGNYSGESAMPDGTFALEVEADGAWTVAP
jgi:hypothetical protein